MVKKRERKYIIVTGGVVSGLGKGTAGASIGKILTPNYKVVPIKYDGYHNIDPDMQNPQEHGEVYVLDEGRVADMDFGHYERFIGINCKNEWSITRGRIHEEINQLERSGHFMGQTIQDVPHIADHIKEKIVSIGEKENADIVIVEIGGVPIQAEAFVGIEAAKRLKKRVGAENILYAHLTQILFLKCTNEQKTFPAQNDLHQLKGLGIDPDIVIARCETTEGIDRSKLEKISDASDIDIESIILAPDTKNIYQIPLNFYHGEIFDLIEDKLLNNKKSRERKVESKRLDKEMKDWESLVQKIDNPSQKGVKVAICGKYLDKGLNDAYASVREALTHAAANLDVKLAKEDILWLNAKKISPENIAQHLEGVDGLIVPGGYNEEGIECMISAIKYARENYIPYLGLCYGLQLAVIEFARNVCNMEGAHTTEIDKATKFPVVDQLDSQRSLTKLGGTQRAGGYDAVLKPGTLVQKLYGTEKCRERHRHRWEVNPEYHKTLQEKGMVFSGMSPDEKLVEFIELKNHPYFVGTQAHNELTSKLEKPNPLFYGFVEAAIKHHKA